MKGQPTAEKAARGLRSRLERHDPFWGPQLVVAGAIALDFALPKRLTIGPSWVLPGLEAPALVGLVAASPHPRMRHSPLRRRLAISLTALVSAANIVSLFLLFGLWYWQRDRDGPVARAMDPEVYPDFLFPQMTDPRYAAPDWQPGLVDYLYGSFSNATAFSPTDTMPLSQNAKWLMSAQSLTALVTIGLVFARAVNIL
jgi:hypothetical protein